MLHHQIVDFLGVLGPPFLLVICMIVFLLPLCCLYEGGCVGWVIGELNRMFFELADCKHSEGSVVFQAVCKVLGDSFNVQVKGGCCFGSPVLSNMMCSRPCMGDVNVGFFSASAAAGG